PRLIGQHEYSQPDKQDRLQGDDGPHGFLADRVSVFQHGPCARHGVLLLLMVSPAGYGPNGVGACYIANKIARAPNRWVKAAKPGSSLSITMRFAFKARGFSIPDSR